MIGCSIWEIEWIFFFRRLCDRNDKKEPWNRRISMLFLDNDNGSSMTLFSDDNIFERDGQRNLDKFGQLKCKSKYSNIWWMADRQYNEMCAVYPFATHQKCNRPTVKFCQRTGFMVIIISFFFFSILMNRMPQPIIIMSQFLSLSLSLVLYVCNL